MMTLDDFVMDVTKFISYFEKIIQKSAIDMILKNLEKAYLASLLP